MKNRLSSQLLFGYTAGLKRSLDRYCVHSAKIHIHSCATTEYRHFLSFHSTMDTNNHAMKGKKDAGNQPFMDAPAGRERFRQS
jgi:hypothetical protein